MASISSLMGSSSSSSIFGNRTNNMITGLASGLDTESMIEGMVQGYQQKILQLQQNKTKVQWQQEAYQSISDKLVEFSRKYTSYAYSTTNLMSASFFNSSVITSTNGKYADKITASGKSSSDISINGVKQLATSAGYRTTASNLGVDGVTATGGDVSLGDIMSISEMSGSLTINYGGTQSVTIEFDETEDFSKGDGTLDTAKFQNAINQKLSKQVLKNKDGDEVSASELIGVTVSFDGTVSLADKGSSGDSVYIDGATGDFAGLVTDLETAVKDESSTFKMDMSAQVIDKMGTKGQYLSEKSFSVTLNGQTKKVTLGKIELQPEDGGDWNKATQRVMQEALDDTFGKGKITVGLQKDDDKYNFSFKVDSGNTLAISATEAGVAEMLFGEGNDNLTTYLDVSKSLKDLGSFTIDDQGKGWLTLGAEGSQIKLEGVLPEPVPEKDRIKDDDGNLTDRDGNKLDEEGYRINDDGERLYNFDVVINGKTVGTYTQDTALETVLNGINSDATAGVSVSYSKLTNQFVFSAKETGETGKIEFGDGLASALFGSTAVGAAGTGGKIEIGGQEITGFDEKSSLGDFKAQVEKKLDGTLTHDADGKLIIAKKDGTTEAIDVSQLSPEQVDLLERAANYTAGQDAIFTATINGTKTEFTRSSNTVDLDGMTVTLEGTFEAQEGDEVSFTSKTDTDKIFDAIKQMVTDFNDMVTQVKKAYTDQPLKKTDGSRYEPLTAEDEEGLSDSEIEAYEEKAKTGILFMDRDLSSLYSQLRDAVVGNGTDAAYLRSIGLSTSYEDGLTTITLDESKLKAALESDLDGVRDAFTKSKEYGATSDGLMASIQKVTDRYAATTGATKGILIEKAGSKYSPTAALDNSMLDKMNEIDKQISSWQSKMSDKVDYYTNKFTQLELLINQMNSQSSTLSGLMGGY